MKRTLALASALLWIAIAALVGSGGAADFHPDGLRFGASAEEAFAAYADLRFESHTGYARAMDPVDFIGHRAELWLIFDEGLRAAILYVDPDESAGIDGVTGAFATLEASLAEAYGDALAADSRVDGVGGGAVSEAGEVAGGDADHWIRFPYEGARLELVLSIRGGEAELSVQFIDGLIGE